MPVLQNIFTFKISNRLTIAFIIILTPFLSFANSTSTTKSNINSDEFYPKHRLLVGVSGSHQIVEGGKAGLSFGYRLHPNLILGLGAHYWRYNHEKYSGENQIFAQQALQSDTISSYDMVQNLELNSMIFFRRGGYARWGPVMLLGVGHSWRTYSQNTRSRGTQKNQTDSTYLSLGGYFQFAFGYESKRPAGHLIQIGPKITIDDTKLSDYHIFSQNDFFSIPVGIEARYAITF